MINLDVVLQESPAEAAAEGLEKIGYAVDGLGMALSVVELVAEAAHLAKGFSETAIPAVAGSAALRTSIAAGALGALAQYIGVWIQLGGAHAAAKAEIGKDHIRRGMSYGVVLGANDAKPNYVRGNFWLNTRPSYPVYREYEEAAQNLQNAALVSGYNQGKRIRAGEKRRFFSDLRARMGDADRQYYDYTTIPWRGWSSEKKKDFYLLCAALFRRDHLI